MISYTILWNSGRSAVLKGSTAKDALRRAKYPADEMNRISLVVKGDDLKSYKWLNGAWIKKEKTQ